MSYQLRFLYSGISSKYLGQVRMSRSYGQDQGQLTQAASPTPALTPAFILIPALTHAVGEPLIEGYFYYLYYNSACPSVS